MERKLAILGLFSGAIFGYLSIILTNFVRTNLINILVVAVYMILVKLILERLKIIDKKPFNWWLSKFYILFILFWFIFWTIFYNIL